MILIVFVSCAGGLLSHDFLVGVGSPLFEM